MAARQDYPRHLDEVDQWDRMCDEIDELREANQRLRQALVDTATLRGMSHR